ncbi:hypothetical protein PVAP13_1NG099600 [Panicum virgatum]|uniref:Uncharacterized protein n=1 Tax=Panicum virgatum TaxID=38727 RepID=A0A8T0WHR0_PANVG|nr:hypothetical protein PVAP13_1NG099600 [Panicum virgatum]
MTRAKQQSESPTSQVQHPEAPVWSVPLTHHRRWVGPSAPFPVASGCPPPAPLTPSDAQGRRGSNQRQPSSRLRGDPLWIRHAR